MSMLVITGARVWRDPGRFEERSIWIRDGRVVELTPAKAGPTGDRDGLDVVSWPGRYILPGFVDAHTHLMAIAHKELRCDLSDARGAADVVGRLSAWASAHPGESLVGVDFDEAAWEDDALPTRVMLNAVSATMPVYARRVCGHAGVVNDALLSKLSRAARFLEAESGRIVEDAVFEANRLMRPPAEGVVAAVDAAIGRLHALGITAIHDIVDPDSIEVYARGLCASRRPLGIAAYLHVGACDYDAAAARLEERSDGRSRPLGIKIFSDGSLGARTAALHQRYHDADTTGELLVTREVLRHEFAACAGKGIGCAVHAIGDRALSTVLDAIDDTSAEPARVRIEHAEVIGENDVERCARLQVPLVMQPNFVRNWGGEGGMYAARLGPARWARQNPFATLLRAGGWFVFSSDAMPSGPLYGIKGATHHPVESERIGAAEAIRRYTGSILPGPAPAGGVLAPGAPADLVVLSGNPILADLDTIRVESTVVGGTEVYRGNREARPISHSKRRR
jgi:predicted amidohydrolase YtcJ